jgi:hypothetical protein
MGLLLLAYLALIVRLARQKQADRWRRLLPHVFVFAAGLATFGSDVLELSEVARKRTHVAGAALLAIGLWAAFRARRTQDPRVDGPSPGR